MGGGPAQGLPFCVAGVGDLLALFRCISCRYCFGTDATKPELLGAPGRVYTTQEVCSSPLPAQGHACPFHAAQTGVYPITRGVVSSIMALVLLGRHPAVRALRASVETQGQELPTLERSVVDWGGKRQSATPQRNCGTGRWCAARAAQKVCVTKETFGHAGRMRHACSRGCRGTHRTKCSQEAPAV